MTKTPTQLLAAALGAALLNTHPLLAAGQAGDPTSSAPTPARMLQLADISVDEMPPQMRDAFIRGIQEELAAHGYVPGAADGVVGARTRTAIREYQRDAGLPVNGSATKELLDHLKFSLPKVMKTAAPAPALPPELVQGVQLELSKRGYYQGAIDGRSGPMTRAAVRAFQQDAGLPVTGTVDERLLGELRLADPSVRAPGGA